MHETIESALADPAARILVHGPVRCDRSGNSRALQSVFSASGECLYTDGRTGSYWYGTENERRAFERAGGLVLTPGCRK